MNTATIPRVRRRAVGVALASALMMIPCTTGIAAETGVPIDAAHFPDPAFRAVVQQYDTNNNGTLSQQELTKATTINADYHDIGSVKGIEYFTSLTYLNLNNNQLSSLDLSHNTALTYLDLDNNQLSSVDVSHNTKLTELYLYCNQLSSVDVSRNTALTILWLGANQLSSVDVSRNTTLTKLWLYSNQLSSVDVSHNTKLTKLSLEWNQLSSVDLSHNTALTELELLGNHQLSSVDVSHNTKLTELSLSDNQLSSVDVSHNTALKKLWLGCNQLSSVDLSHNTKLEWLDLSHNYLDSVNLSHNTKLTKLWLSRNYLFSVDLSHNTALTELEFYSNQLSSVDVSHNTALTKLSLSDNQLSSVDLGHNTKLTDLYLGENQLSSVDLSHNTKLTNLHLNDNRLLWVGGVSNSVNPDLSGQREFGPVSAVSLDLAKAAPGIDVSRISNVQGGRLQGTVLTPANADGRVTYDYRFSDAHEPLHARVRFDAPSFTVAFDTNGGSGNTTISVVSGKTVASPAAPTRDGYAFDGWYTAKDGGSKYDFSKPVTGDLTLYAHWTKNTPAKITFRDVSGSTPHHGDIQWLADNGISTGWKTADGRYEFRGMSVVVRQDMAAFLRREAVKRNIGDAKTWKPTDADWKTFRDVNRGTPHAEDILWLAHAGISTGWKEADGSSTFRGMNPVVRQDMAAFLRRLAKLGRKDGGVTPKTDFTDVSDATPHADDVRWLGGSGISTGYRNPNGTWRFEGMTSVYRQDMAAFLHRLDNQLNK